MNLVITPTSEEHFEGLYAALDVVARERRYLAFLQAPPREEAFAFYRGIVANGLVQFVAVLDGEVVGSCDVLPLVGDARAHAGHLGLFLVPRARHRGIGAQLLNATLDAARAKGFTRVELTVRADNANAIALYRRAGFAHEGTQRRAFRVGEDYFDSEMMALVW